MSLLLFESVNKIKLTLASPVLFLPKRSVPNGRVCTYLPAMTVSLMNPSHFRVGKLIHNSAEARPQFLNFEHCPKYEHMAQSFLVTNPASCQPLTPQGSHGHWTLRCMTKLGVSMLHVKECMSVCAVFVVDESGCDHIVSLEASVFPCCSKLVYVIVVSEVSFISLGCSKLPIVSPCTSLLCGHFFPQRLRVISSGKRNFSLWLIDSLESSVRGHSIT